MVSKDEKKASKFFEERGRMLTVGGVAIDLKTVTPMNVGDAETIEGSGVRLASGGTLLDSVANMKKYLGHFVRKANANITDDQLNELPSWKMVIAIRYIQDVSAVPADPNS